MALDGMFVGKLADELNRELRNGRIDSIDGLNKTDYLFGIRVPGKSYSLYMSISYNNPTVFIAPVKMEKPMSASSFTMYLRKYFVGAYITNIYQYNFDRIIMIDIERKDEMEGIIRKTLVLELIGRFSNLLILDEDEKIVEAIKQLSVLDDNSRGIMKGLKYEPLINNKMSPKDETNINKTFALDSDIYEQNLVDKISGISPKLAIYLVSTYRASKKGFFEVFKDETNKFDPVLKGTDYYYFNIFDNDVEHFDSLSNLLYTYYERNAEAKILRDNNTRIFQIVQSNLKRLKKKIVKLEDELEEDKNSDELRLFGELLLANINSNDARTTSITVNNYYTGEDIAIPIDPSKSIKENSALYFKRYRKSKNALEHIVEQITITKNEIEYFELLSFQLKNASLRDMIEIKNELIQNGYYHSNENISKRKVKPNFEQIKIKDSIIYIGHNNIQNDFITHTIAKKDDLWFHTKDSHGSHVVVSGENKYDEDVIRFAAKEAAMHSEAKDSSSVPVDYTLVKYLKKVPGTKGSFVSYSHQKTIYIDPKREEN